VNATSLTQLAGELAARARQSRSGRAAHTVYGRQQHGLRQTLVALAGGHELADHESPQEGMRHALAALDDAVVLLTVRVRS
jgi:hypothetical protein